MRGAPLTPFDPREAIGTAEAARRTGRSERTVREWAALYRIGRRIAGRWAISAPALEMLLAGDHAALAAYLNGERASDQVRAYFETLRIPLQIEPASPPSEPMPALN